MKRIGPTYQILALTALIMSLTLGLRAASVAIAPANASLLVGQTLQLTAPGAVVPASIATGALHTCVLYSDQSVRCTGLNSQGEIGNGTTTNALEPALAAGTVNPATIRTGVEHTCTLVGDGTMQCWGTNYTGQLGDGTMGSFAVAPQLVHGIANAIKAITGGFHTCAILPDRTVQCWGRNQDGQLGNGDATTDVPLPGPVQNLGAVADLSSFGYHNCALMPDRTAMCWGRNGRGQVGDGTDNSPVTLPHQVVGMNSAIALSLGGYHSCALLQGGTVQCWGESEFGQSGVVGFSKVPVTVSGIANATAIASGFRHSCALQSDGTVRCWGHNDFGQLGDGTTTDSASPVQVQSIANPLAIAAGEVHTCALMPDLSVQCWGGNSSGSLGDGTGVNSLAPVKMHFTGLTWTSSNPSVATISASGLVTGVARGTSTITATDGFGNVASTTVTVRQLLTLAVVRQGDGLGTLTSNPAGIACGATCTASFMSDSPVTLTAAAGIDSIFTGWTGCDSVSGATCTVTMSNARSVTAIFMLQRFTLSVSKTSVLLGNGTVTPSPSGINCGTACSSDYVVRTQVTLTAAPALGSLFTGWSGCDAVNGASCTVAMTAAKRVTASFTGVSPF